MQTACSCTHDTPAIIDLQKLGVAAAPIGRKSHTPSVQRSRGVPQVDPLAATASWRLAAR